MQILFQKLYVKKSSGLYGIPATVLKNCGTEVAHILARPTKFYMSWYFFKRPENRWVRASTWKRFKSSSANYRMSILSMMSKTKKTSTAQFHVTLKSKNLLMINRMSFENNDPQRTYYRLLSISGMNLLNSMGKTQNSLYTDSSWIMCSFSNSCISVAIDS